MTWKWGTISDWVSGVENRMGNMQVALHTVREYPREPIDKGEVVYAYVQVRGMSRDLSRPDSNSCMVSWTGRKWLISQHMTETEVVNTCYLALVQATMHELQEAVHYHGRAVFDPHAAVWDRQERDVPQDVRVDSIKGAK